MGAIRIYPVEVKEDGHLVQSVLEVNGLKHLIYFRSPQVTLNPGLEAFLACAIFPAMKRRVDCYTEGHASAHFIHSLDDIQAVLQSWKPQFGRVNFHGLIPEARPRLEAKRVGLFFSAGTDSTYSFLRHQNEITDLIFIRGFDIALKYRPMLDEVADAIGQFAAHFGKNLIQVETNLQPFLNRFETWNLSYGAALAAVGHLLPADFRKIYIAAAYPAHIKVPAGAHPDLDPLWGTEGLEFVHDGQEADRIQKIPLIAEYPIALQSLRFCLRPQSGAYNCGRCEKCLRSMIFLRAQGIKDGYRVATPLDVSRVARYRASSPLSLEPLETSLKILEQRQADPELAAALRCVLERPDWQKNWISRLRAWRRKWSIRLRRLGQRSN